MFERSTFHRFTVARVPEPHPEQRTSGTRLHSMRDMALGVLAVLLVAGCDPAIDAPAGHRASAQPTISVDVSTPHDVQNVEVSRWLAGLKSAMAPFHDLDNAKAAGWTTQITGCLAMPDTGGMGYHIQNPGLWDAGPQQFAPQLLVYAPRRNGSMELAAVEFVVPFTDWPADAAQPPMLHDIPFHQNNAFGLWVLHAWIFKHNPLGMFSDWNPDVSCAFAH